MPPAPTTRVQPPGRPMEDGYRTLITFAADPDVKLWEKSVTPPGFDGGEAIPTSTMWNEVLRTFALPGLRTMSDASGRCAYDPAVYPQIEDLVNVETTITVRFPNGATLAFFGGLRTFTPGELVEGQMPEADFAITSTNTDPTTGSEASPVYTAGS